MKTWRVSQMRELTYFEASLLRLNFLGELYDILQKAEAPDYDWPNGAKGAVREEMAVQLDDVIFRRTGLGTLGHPGRACLDRCASIMGVTLGWSDAYRAKQVAKTTALFLRSGDDDDETA